MKAAPKPEKSILVAEDNPADLLLLRRAVQQICGSVRFHFVGDGEEVVNYLNGSGKFADTIAFPYPSLLLMDFHLPKLSGLEVLQWIKLQIKHAGIRVIMWSDSDFGSDFKKAFAAGAEQVLRRPSGIDELTQFLSKFVKTVEA